MHLLLPTHFTNNSYTNYYRWHWLAFIKQMQLHISLQLSTITPLLTIITHVEGSNGVKTEPMQHLLPFLNNTVTNPIEIPEDPF